MKKLSKAQGIILSKTWNSCFLFALTLLCSISANAQPNVFLPSVVPNRHFPKPVQALAVPTGPFSPLLHPTFYYSRNGGSCYNSTFDFDGDADDDNVNVWSICHSDVATYDNAVAYEVTDLTGTTLYRGCAYVGGDIANLQVGMYTPNGFAHHLVVAFWRPGVPSQIELNDYAMTTTGLLLNSSNVIATLANTTGRAQEISLDCHDNNRFVVAWEDVGYPIGIKAYDYSPFGFGIGPVNSFGGSNYRLPDVAMSHDGATQYDVHVAAVDVSTSPATIVEYLIDFSTMGGAITPVMQDAFFAGTSFGPDWDDFQLKIDAPDHYTPGFPKWAYTYFSDDNNKISVRISNAGTYYNGVVNDGSMVPSSTMIALPDLTIAGNAFPTISWTPPVMGCMWDGTPIMTQPSRFLPLLLHPTTPSIPIQPGLSVMYQL